MYRHRKQQSSQALSDSTTSNNVRRPEYMQWKTEHDRYSSPNDSTWPKKTRTGEKQVNRKHEDIRLKLNWALIGSSRSNNHCIRVYFVSILYADSIILSGF